MSNTSKNAMNTTTNVTTLRVLTRKSKLGFGRYSDWTVSDMLIYKPSYIPWAYYCVSGISFCEDILQQCGINNRIEKPGRDESAFRAYQKEKTDMFSKDERDHHFWRISQVKKKKARAALTRAITNTSFTKGELQSINHGRK